MSNHYHIVHSMFFLHFTCVKQHVERQQKTPRQRRRGTKPRGSLSPLHICSLLVVFTVWPHPNMVVGRRRLAAASATPPCWSGSARREKTQRTEMDFGNRIWSMGQFRLILFFYFFLISGSQCFYLKKKSQNVHFERWPL